jgi:hypothetical protein
MRFSLASLLLIGLFAKGLHFAELGTSLIRFRSFRFSGDRELATNL